MKTTHALSCLSSLLVLPLFAVLGCAVADGGTIDDESADDAVSPRNASGAATQSVNSGHGINYHDGPIMSGHVKIYYVLYGNWSSTDRTIVENFADDVGGSPNYNINTLYDDSSG